MYALIDCNNFYASCERLFRPDLHDKPIVVLSSNDGCVIARSNEAKACGIAMGIPYFKIKALCKQKNVHVFSSNFVLYGDLSNRVMTIIHEEWPEMEQYSIDEAFLDLRSMSVQQHDHFCARLQKIILKSTGIPTSIGIGATRTLAKMANHICKKELNIPVFNLNQHMAWLTHIAIGDVWGVGRQWQKKLIAHNIQTAADLANLSSYQLKAQFNNILLMRTVWELQGINCDLVHEDNMRKSIISSRSFSDMHSELYDLIQAMSEHARNAYQKLRQQHLLVKQITIFVYTNRFRRDLPQHNQRLLFTLINPTDDLRLITRITTRCLKQLFKPGFQYKKVGVCFDHLMPKTHQQLDLLHQPTEEELAKKDHLMSVFDAINQRFGRHTMKLAAEGFVDPCSARASMRSPFYTTQWSDLPKIRM